MSSLRRINSSRANGARSKGPITPAGKARSSKNATRQRRAWAIETRIMNGAISTQPPDQDELTRLADGFTSIAAQPPLELMHRYETRLHRIFQRALANLILMRSLPELNPPENIELPNDPSPHSPIRAPNVREGLCEATQPVPCAENIELPNDPSPITGHLVQGATHLDSYPQLQSRARRQAVARRLTRLGFA